MKDDRVLGPGAALAPSALRLPPAIFVRASGARVPSLRVIQPPFLSSGAATTSSLASE